MRLDRFLCIYCRRKARKKLFKLMILGALVTGFYMTFGIFKHLLMVTFLIIDVSLDKLHVVSLDTIGLNKCPACFGVNYTLCDMIKQGVIRVKKNYPWSEEAEKNVRHGVWDNKAIVIKSLGRTVEYQEYDRKICETAGLQYPCDIQSAIWRSFLNSAKSLEGAIKDVLDCPSHRFIKKVKAKYGSGNVLLVYERFFLYNTLKFNQEPLLLQVFPSEEGWPFPKYHGACGRVIVTEDCGKSLDHFLYHPWTVRAQLAVNLLRIAQQLTVNKQNWALYMLDVSLNNFAMSDDGSVKLVDVEHLIVVDLETVSMPNATPVPAVDECEPDKPDCLAVSPVDLCRGTVRDLNYLAVCKGVLADSSKSRGLLNSVPKYGNFGAKIKTEVENCIKSKATDREPVVKKLITLLMSTNQ